MLDFFLGLLLGAGLGVGLTLAVGRVRRWLGRSEAGRLAAENRELKRRLAEKDRHITRMLAETERLAEKLRHTARSPKPEEPRKLEGTLAVAQEEAK
ncbi:MAG: hypothetical protein JRI59_07430 [Deltaproteobacteria bacterium]|nr:hypothetical protein [Deltaproteobacteria bacterium]